jgi:hypothetical protein
LGGRAWLGAKISQLWEGFDVKTFEIMNLCIDTRYGCVSSWKQDGGHESGMGLNRMACAGASSEVRCRQFTTE